MKKNGLLFLLLIAILLNSQITNAQKINKDSLNNNTIKSNLSVILSNQFGVEWKQRVTRQSSVSIFGGMGVGFATDGFILSNLNAPLIFIPISSIEYKNYYNFLKRSDNKKNVKNNSANFVFGEVTQFYAVKNQNYFGLLFTAGWGLQRYLFKNISFECRLSLTEHIYYDKPPNGGFNYILTEPNISFFFFYTLFKY